MRKSFPRFMFSLLLTMSLFSACTPKPPALPTVNPTLVAVAAEATVTALAREKGPVSNIPATQSPAAPSTAPATPAPQASDFWVTFLFHSKINLINSDGTKTSMLTNTPGIDWNPTWSPDGKYLAFIRFDGNDHTNGILHVLPSGADTPHPLNANSSYNNFFWMPDGKQILATRGVIGDYKVDLVDITSGQPTDVVRQVVVFPSLSPDGKKIAMLINNGESCSGMGCNPPNDLFVVDVASREIKTLTTDKAPKMSLAWSPDSQQIAYHLSNDSGNLVEILQPDGKVIASKQAPPWWTANWVRSPDGSQIAYFITDTNNGETDIFVRPAAGGDPRKVTHLSKNADQVSYIDTLRWRPDGSGLVFNMWTKVYTINLDGSDLRTLPVTLENIFFDVRPTNDPYTPPPSPTAPASWKICPGALDTRLDVGRKAQVSTNPPTANNLREGPGKNLRLVGQIQPGETVEILDGPVCDQGLIWWQVRSQVSGLQGYTLEGDQKTYWLVPLP